MNLPFYLVIRASESEIAIIPKKDATMTELPFPFPLTTRLMSFKSAAIFLIFVFV